MQHLIPTFVAVALLIGLPVFVPAPESELGFWLAVGVAVVLAAVAVRGVVHFVRSRKPKTYLDSIMPEKEPPTKVSIMEPPKE